MKGVTTMKLKMRIFSLLMLLILSAAFLFSCSDTGNESCTEHSFSGEWTVKIPATTEAEGQESNVCDVCNEEVTRVIPKHEHTFSEAWTVITPATKTEDGERSCVCDTCGETVIETVSYCETHTFTANWTVKKAPTLTAAGRESNTCDVCGATITRAISKLSVTELKITQTPYTTSYFNGELFNPYGLEVSAVLSDGSTVVIKDYELLTKSNLTPEDTSVTIKYGELTADFPITVSPFIRGSVTKSFTSDDGTQMYIRGYCAALASASDGTKQILVKDLTANSFILLTGTNYDYEVGDKIEFYATVASDTYGKYLTYASENGNGEDTVISQGNAVTVGDANKYAIGKDRLEALFADGISRYDTVEFGERFYIAKDGDDYIIHFNKDATDKSGAALACGKTVKVSLKSIDGRIISERFSEAELNSFPGALVSGSISAIYLNDDTESFKFEIVNKDWVLIDRYVSGQEYLTELAYAFYYQLPNVDYEQYNTRRNVNPAPEDATAQQRIYLDCSSYVNAVYYNAFGVNVMPYTISEKGATTANFNAYAKENPNNADVICYYETANHKNPEEQKAILKELLSKLEVGDVIVYRKPSSGHALIYVGGGKILHCMNTESYSHDGNNPENAADWISSSSIGFESTYNLFENPFASRYLFSYVSFAILRPMNRGLTATEQTEARMTIPSLSIEKLVDVNMYSAVFTGDELTYTVTLKNNGRFDLDGIQLSERIPNGTEFVSASEGISHSNGAISWSGSVKAGETVTLSFKVRVTATEAGTLIESNEGKVNGLELNKITNTLSGISREKLDELSDIGYTAAESRTEYADPILMINAIYKELIGNDILSYATTAEALSDIIDVEGLKYNQNCAAKDIVIENLSGGYLIKGKNPHNNNRIRAVRIEYLTVGDVIIAEHVNKDSVTVHTAYVYLGESDFLAITTTEGKASLVKCNEPDIKKIQNILTSLYSYDKYAIIRPSMANSAE